MSVSSYYKAVCGAQSSVTVPECVRACVSLTVFVVRGSGPPSVRPAAMCFTSTALGEKKVGEAARHMAVVCARAGLRRAQTMQLDHEKGCKAVDELMLCAHLRQSGSCCWLLLLAFF